MTDSERQSRKRRLERAGYRALPVGWVKEAYAKRVEAQIASYADEVQRVLNEPAKPRGRPKKA